MFSHPAAPPPPQGICLYRCKTGFYCREKVLKSEFFPHQGKPEFVDV